MCLLAICLFSLGECFNFSSLLLILHSQVWLGASLLDSASLDHHDAGSNLETQCNKDSEFWRQMDQVRCSPALQIYLTNHLNFLYLSFHVSKMGLTPPISENEMKSINIHVAPGIVLVHGRENVSQWDMPSLTSQCSLKLDANGLQSEKWTFSSRKQGSLAITKRTKKMEGWAVMKSGKSRSSDIPCRFSLG